MIRIYNDNPEDRQIYFQEEATSIAGGIIDLHNKAMYYIIIIVIMVTYLVIKVSKKTSKVSYNRIRNHSTIVELIWTITPGIILIIIGIPSLKLLYAIEDHIDPRITLKVIGHQWYWSYEINDIEDFSLSFDSYTLLDSDNPFFRLLEVDSPVLLPILQPIRLLITSTDVIHSFFVPSLGIKMDAIPGRINHTSIFLLRPGTFFGQCAELCGNAHAQMSIVIKGINLEEYIEYMKENWVL